MNTGESKMVTLKEKLYDAYEYKKGLWNEDDITDIIRTVKDWLNQKNPETFDSHEPNGAERILKELLEELENDC